MKFKFTWRDATYLFGGIIIGLIAMYFYFSGSLVSMLNNLRIESVVIGFNESKIVEIAYEMIK